MMLVTLEEAKAQISVDYDVSDALIELHVKAASRAVCNYLKDAQYTFLDTSGELPTDTSGDPITSGVPPEVKMATLVLIDDFFNHRGPAPTDPVDPQYGYGYLPRAVVALLYPLRDPAYA
jgi:hypothetical protein